MEGGPRFLLELAGGLGWLLGREAICAGCTERAGGLGDLIGDSGACDSGLARGTAS